ncbi:MAG TPA: carboxypeptidase M32 [Spirochaetota bacterium]|nr:carboxypeptidase M32 [Spirochaetota bacterium]
MGEKIAEFRNRWEKISRLNHALAVLHWDMETYMPEKGINGRSGQISLLSEIAHKWLTADETIRSIEAAELETAGDEYYSDSAAMLRAARRQYEQQAKLPESLVVQFAETTAEANSIWVKARSDNDFPAFSQSLEKIVSLNREMAECLGYRESPYDALLDLYEPDMTASMVAPLFNAMKERLVPMVKAVSEKGNEKNPLEEMSFDVNAQERFGLMVLGDMGYDFSRGRQDRSAHPFTTSFGPWDVRITTRFHEQDLLSALFSTIHEGGHALYEQGLPLDMTGTPLCEAVSLGVHESQSRLWENIVGRSREFWGHYFPKLRKHFPTIPGGINEDLFYRLANRVEPGLVRVESDEVTYNLHIFIRFEIEQELIAGTLRIQDLPERWNEGYRSYLGIVPPDDARGCLQDIHWAHGSFGYFPTYSLGNLLSAQFFNAAEKAVPDLKSRIAGGDLGSLKEWLNEHIHCHGARYTMPELVKEVTGEKMRAEPFLDYLEIKFNALYNMG